MKNKFYFSALLIILFISKNTSAQPQYEFAYGLGSIGTEYVNSIAIDNDNNFYLAGSYSQSLDFDPSAYTTTLEPEGNDDAYFCKYDEFGQLVWGMSIGGNNADGVNEIFVDDAGNVYVAGYFAGTADLDPDLFAVNVTAVGDYDIFFAKYDNTGDFLWGGSIGGPDDEFCSGIGVDAAGNVYLTGGFQSTVDFDPYIIDEYEATSFGNYDGFLAKYSSDGNFIWVNAYGGVGIDYSTDMAIDNDGNILIGGAFEGTVPFGGGNTLTAAGGALYETDPFFAKYDADGSIYWAKSIYGNPLSDAYYPNYVIAMETDNENNVIVTGNFWVTADFDPGAGTAELTPVSGADTYIAKYDTDGNYMWAVNYCGITYENSNDIAVDAQNDIYVIGLFAESATVDFDPSEAGELFLESEGDYDIYLTKYSAGGDMLWAFNAGGTWADYGFALAVNDNFDIYCGGWYWSTVADFYPGDGDATITHFDGGGEDIWFAKYAQPELVNIAEENIHQNNLQSVQVFPNPASEKIITVWNNTTASECTMYITDINGSIIKEICSNQTFAAGLQQVELNIEDINSGIYFLSIKSNEQTTTEKLIIQH